MGRWKQTLLIGMMVTALFVVISPNDAEAYIFRSCQDGDWFATGSTGTWERFSGFGWYRSWQVPNFYTTQYYSDRVYVLNDVTVNNSALVAKASDLRVGGATSTNAITITLGKGYPSGFINGEQILSQSGDSGQVISGGGWGQIVCSVAGGSNFAVGDTITGQNSNYIDTIASIMVSNGAAAQGRLFVGKYGTLEVERRQVYYYVYGVGWTWQPGGDMHIEYGTFHIEGHVTVNGALVCGIGTYATDATRGSELMMTGGVLNVRYGNLSMYTANISGGIMMFPGTIETLLAGDIHIAGWFVGGYDSITGRIFDMHDSSCVVYMDDGNGGPVYPHTALIYCMDQYVNSQPMSFGTLTIDRPGQIVQAQARIEIHQNFTLIDGTFQGPPPSGVNISFEGQIPGNWITQSGQYNNLIPVVNNKKGRLTLRSPNVELPAFGVNNPYATFSLFIDPSGAITKSLQVLDGRVWITSGLLEVRGYLQFGSSTSVPGVRVNNVPQFDQVGTGTVWINDMYGNPWDGDFYFQLRALENLVAGTLKVEGDVAVDNAGFWPSGTHTLEMSGARSTNIWNNQTPVGFSVPTIVLQNFSVRKTGTAQANPISSMCVNGDLFIFSGVLNANSAGWAITLKGQWPVNNGDFTPTTVVEVQTPGLFILPPGKGPIIRINKSDGPALDQRAQMGAALSCWGLQVFDGTFDFMGRTLTVTGNVVVGTGNAALDAVRQPELHMVHYMTPQPVPAPPTPVVSGGGILIVNSQGTTDGSFVVFEHSITPMDAGRIDVEGDIKIDSTNFQPTGSHFIRLVGNRGASVQMWCNKPAAASHLDLWHMMFMKDTSGPAIGAQVDLGSTVYIHGKFTMYSGTFNASIPAAPVQVLHLKGTPDAWAGMGGEYTDVHGNSRFQIMIDGSGTQNCFSGDLSAASQQPDIIIYKNGPTEYVRTLGGTLHAHQLFIARGGLHVEAGAVFSEGDMFVGGGVPAVDQANMPALHIDSLNGLVECKGDFYFMAGAIETVTHGIIKAHNDFKVVDISGREFDLFDQTTDRAVLEMTGSGSPADIFRADTAGMAQTLNLFEWSINKTNASDRVEAYSPIMVNGPFSVIRGTVATPGGVVNICGNWITMGGGAYDPTANLSLNGLNSVQVITSNVTLPNIIVDKPGTNGAGNRAVVPSGGLLSTQNFWIRQGVFCLNGGSMTVNGDFVVGGATVPAASCARLEITAATGGGTLQVVSTTSGNGNFYFNHGHNEEAAIDAGRISVEGVLGIADDPLPNPPNFRPTGTNVMELIGNRGTPTSIWSSSGQLELAQLVVIKTGTIPGNQVDMISNLKIDRDFRVVQGMYNTNNFTMMEVGGDWIVSSGCYYMPSVCRVELTGTNGVPVTISVESSNAAFYDLVIDLPVAGDVCDYVSITGRPLVVNNTLWVNVGDFVVPSDLHMEVGTGSSGVPYLILGDTNNASANGTLRVGSGTELVLGHGLVLSVEGNAFAPTSPTGELYLDGTAAHPVTLTTQIPGNRRFKMNVWGLFEAEHYRIDSMDAEGLKFGANAIIDGTTDNLSSGSFDYPATNGVVMDLSAFGDTTDIPDAIRYCDFSNSGGATNVVNVKGNTGWNVGTDLIYFLESTGVLAGEDYDSEGSNDNINGGCIQWSVGTIQVELGAADPGASSRLNTHTNITAMQLNLSETSAREGVNLTSLTVSDGGVAFLGNVSGVELWLDNDSDGERSTGDVQLGTTQTFAGGQVTFTGAPLFQLGLSGSYNVIVVYQFTGAAGLPWTFQPYVSASADLSGTTLVTVLPAEITGAFPLYGGIMTVADRGSLTVSQGAGNPPAGMVVRGMNDAPLQQIHLATGGAEPVNVAGLTFSLTLGGTGALESELTNLRLVRDTNADGFYQPGSDTQVGTSQSWSGGTATFSGSPLLALNALEELDLLLVCDVAGTVSGSEIFRTSVTNAAALAAQGNDSVLVITPAGSFPVWGNAQSVTLQPTIFAVAGANNPPARGVDKAGLNQAMLQVRLVGLGDTLYVERMEFANSGTVNPSAAVAQAVLIEDANGNGGRDTGETVLGTTTSIGGTVVFTWTGPARPALLNNHPVHWLLCYDLNGQGLNGETLTASIPASGITGMWGTTQINVSGLPFSGGQVTLLDGVGTLDVSVGSLSPAAGWYSSTASNKVMAQLAVTAGPHEPVRLLSVTVHGTGTGNEATDINTVALFEDTDHDGAHSTFDNLLSTTLYSVDDGTVTFNSSPLMTIASGETAHLLVVYSFSGTSAHGDTFQVEVESSVDLVAEGELSFASISVGGTFPLVGNSMKIVVPGTLSISAGPRNPLSTFEMLQSQNLAALQIGLAANAHEDLSVTRIMLTAQGTANDAADIVAGSVRLYRDVDRNGLLSGPDELIEPVTYTPYRNSGQYPPSWGRFGGDDGTVSFSNIEEVITAGTTQYWLVVMDIGHTAMLGSTFSVQVSNSTDLDVTGLLSLDPATVTGAPAQGGVKTIGVTGSLSLFPGLNSPPSRNESPTAQNVEIVQFALSASTVEPVRLETLTITAFSSGNADDLADLTMVHLYRDAHNNGLLDPDPAGPGYLDTLLGSGAYNADNGIVTFGLPSNEIIAANNECNYLVVYDLSGSASTGESFVAGVANNSDIVASGAVGLSTIQVAGAPLQGPSLMMGLTGSVMVSYGPYNPGPRYLPNSETNVEIIHVTLKATSIEDVDIDSITFRAGGTADDGATLMASLWEDTNGDGRGNVLVGTPGQAYTADNGTVTFTGIGLTVPAAATRYLVMTYDFSFDAAATAGQTYEARLIPTLDLSCTGGSSGSSLFATGAMIFSSRFRVGVDPANQKFLTLPSGSSGGGCFVATASFGSLQTAEVASLTTLRDDVLQRSALGRAFVNAYYRLSPPAADAIRNRPAARAAVRTALGPVVGLAGLTTEGTATSRTLFALLALAFLAAVLGLGRRTLRKARA